MKTTCILDIGINHNSSLDIAKQLIKVCAENNCTPKFQKRNPDLCVPEHQKKQTRETPWGTMTYLEYKYRMEFNKEQYDEIDRYCRELGTQWSASVWDLDSLEFMKQYEVPFLKIPSALITNEELVRETAKYCQDKDIRFIASLGMSTAEEIDHLIKSLKDIIFGDNVVLMWCNSSYPAPTNELNLRALKQLNRKYGLWYGVTWGYSGHELDLVTTASSIYLGAEYIERHVTIDKTLYGSDQKCSLEPQDVKQLIGYIELLESAYGNGKIEVTESQIPIRKKLRGN